MFSSRPCPSLLSPSHKFQLLAYLRPLQYHSHHHYKLLRCPYSDAYVSNTALQGHKHRLASICCCRWYIALVHTGHTDRKYMYTTTSTPDVVHAATRQCPSVVPDQGQDTTSYTSASTQPDTLVLPMTGTLFQPARGACLTSGWTSSSTLTLQIGSESQDYHESDETTPGAQ